jgi:hypothetical protein
MSNFIPKPNTGTLWPNDRKTAPNHPDVRGDVHIDRRFLQDMIAKADGDIVKIQISGWEKVIAGKNCVSLSLSAPYVPQEGGAPRRQVQPRAQASDEDVPF